MDVRVAVAKDGNEILEIEHNNQNYRLNSAYKPFVEAEKFAAQYNNLSEDSVLMVFGFGNGIFPEEIMKICNSNTKVIFYEPCKEVITCARKRIDIASFCDKWGCILVTDGLVADKEKSVYTLAEFPKVLKEVVLYHKSEKIQYCILPKYKELFAMEYEQYRNTITLHIQVMQANIHTAKEIGHRAVVNNVKLLKYIPDSYCADSFVELFPENMPVVLVSAGPSLEKNVKVLEQAKDRALVVCVDTAVKYLLKADILPDMVVTIDPRKALNLFEDERLSDIPLVGVTDMSWEVLDKVHSKMLILTESENPYIQRLYAEEGHTLGALDSGGSVATLAYSFCRYMGFKRLIMVGQDLALTGNQMYAGNEKLSMDTFNREIILVEDVNGGNVYTTRDYYYYLKWFEQRVGMYQEMQVIDATEGGAKITGTLIMPLQEALDKYAKQQYDISSIIAKAEPVFKGEKRNEVRTRILKDRQIYDQIIMEFQRGITLAKKAKRLISNGTPQQQALKCVRINKEISGICNMYQSSDVSFMVQREIDATDLENYMRIYEEDREGTPQRQYEVVQDYFECVLQATKNVKALFDELEM